MRLLNAELVALGAGTPPHGTNGNTPPKRLLAHGQGTGQHRGSCQPPPAGVGSLTDPEVAPSRYKDSKELDSAESAELAKGGSVEGDVIFQVPVADRAAQLTWQTGFFDNKSDYVWGLGL